MTSTPLLDQYARRVPPGVYSTRRPRFPRWGTLLLLTALLLTLGFATGCSEVGAQSSAPRQVYLENLGGDRYSTGSAVRLVDTRYGVVCYRFHGYEGISCLPLAADNQRAR
jgi:hypothetical protein